MQVAMGDQQTLLHIKGGVLILKRAILESLAQ